MPNVLIGGGSGLIGSRLSKVLAQKGYEVFHLSRRPDRTGSFPAIAWDSFQDPDQKEVWKQAEYILNFAGAGIADKRWTDKRKKLIIESRVGSNRTILKAVRELGLSPKALVSASAIGYYGDRGDAWMQEDEAPGTGFLSESVRAWEESITEWESTGLRVAGIRIGLVLSTRGGALPKLMLPLRFLAAPYFGDGRQWMSWIHIDDLVRLFARALEEETMTGIWNGVAPEPAQQRDFMAALGRLSALPAIRFPIPAAILRLAMGEMSHTVLDSARVSADKVLSSGFTFHHPDLASALKDLKARRV